MDFNISFTSRSGLSYQGPRQHEAARSTHLSLTRHCCSPRPSRSRHRCCCCCSSRRRPRRCCCCWSSRTRRSWYCAARRTGAAWRGAAALARRGGGGGAAGGGRRRGGAGAAGVGGGRWWVQLPGARQFPVARSGAGRAPSEWIYTCMYGEALIGFLDCYLNQPTGWIGVILLSLSLSLVFSLSARPERV